MPLTRGSVLVRRFVSVLGLALLLGSTLAACSSSGPSSTTSARSSTAPTPGAAPVFPVPSKNFSSAALGISFRYPAAWRAGTRRGAIRGDAGTVTFRSPNGGVGVGVIFIRPAQRSAPYPFGDADNLDLSQQRSGTGGKILYSGLVTIGGLRLVEIESLGGVLPGTAPWRYLQFSSAGMGGDLDTLHTSILSLYVGCPSSKWRAQRATLMAVVASMRLSKPKG